MNTVARNHRRKKANSNLTKKGGSRLDQFLRDLERKLEDLQKRNDCDLRTVAALRIHRLSMSPSQTVSLDEEIRKLTPEIIDQETRISELQTKIRQTRVDAEEYCLTKRGN